VLYTQLDSIRFSQVYHIPNLLGCWVGLHTNTLAGSGDATMHNPVYMRVQFTACQ